ncbi:TonB-dependent siderophore receptor [Bowmanella denitrificans]|uniref:TonB-dependent siderophore receptor n=1 Tax=Bowmanella denitrificans TaxID=366582 RepID=UPI000C99A49D|nr:TonB-dependent receptor [Bowmanella denitrificans]
MIIKKILPPILLTGAFSAVAQDHAAGLERIVITADRIESFAADYVQAGGFRNARLLDSAQTTNVLTKELLQAQQANTLADAIRNSAGVTAAQIDSAIYTNLSIRGIHLDNTTNYRLNGALPLTNYVQLPMDNKNRVEVLKGASGLFYGFGSPSGMINLVTERAHHNGLEFDTFANLHGTLGAALDWSRVFNDAGLRVNLSQAEEENGLERSQGQRQFASVGYHIHANERLTFEFDGEYIQRDMTEPAQYYLLADADGNTVIPPLQKSSVNHGSEWFTAESEATNLLAKASYAISDNLDLSLSLGQAKTRATRRYAAFYGFDVDSGEGGTLALSTFPNSEYKNRIAELQLSGSTLLAGITHEWVLGMARRESDSILADRVRQGNWSQHLYHPLSFPEQPKPARQIKNQIEITDTGYYAGLRSVFTPWLQTTIGYRVADYRNQNLLSDYQDRQGAKSASIVVSPTEEWRLYSSYTEGLEEGGIAQGIAKNAGEVLPAALSKQYEIGSKYQNETGLMLSLALFDIERASAFIHPQSQYFVQDGRARYRGAEINASGELTRRLSLSASLTYIDSEQQRTSSDTLTGKRIENTPDTTASVFLRYQFEAIEGLSVTSGLFHTSKRAVDAINSTFVGGYTLFDAGVEYRFSHWPVTVSLYGQNLTNKKHWAATGSRLLSQGLPSQIKLKVSSYF